MPRRIDERRLPIGSGGLLLRLCFSLAAPAPALAIALTCTHCYHTLTRPHSVTRCHTYTHPRTSHTSPLYQPHTNGIGPPAPPQAVHVCVVGGSNFCWLDRVLCVLREVTCWFCVKSPGGGFDWSFSFLFSFLRPSSSVLLNSPPVGC